MSHLVSRSWAALLVASALALSACSTSDTSGIRTRNSALVDTCLAVNPSAGTPTIAVTINDTTCATGIVEIKESVHTPYPGNRLNDPVSDRKTAVNTQFSFDHEFGEYSRAYEARKNETPVEYVQITGNGNDPSSLQLQTSLITEVQVGDICLKPYTPSVGVYMQECTDSDSFLYTDSISTSFPHTYTISDRAVSYGGWPQREFTETENYYFSIIARKNGFPQARMTISLTKDFVPEYRFYSYSQPTTVFPFAAPAEDTNTATSSPDTTSSVGNVSTTVFETSTTTPAETNETTTSSSPETTDAPSPSTTGPINISALSQQFSDDCEQLDGFEIYPARSEWTDSTRFEFVISNDCMTRPTYNDIDTRYVWHEMVATNSETGRRVYFPLQGDPRTRVSFNGRLTAGEWTIDITQYASSALPEGTSTFAARSFPVNVAADPNSDWKWCTKDDIVVSASQIVADCDYSSASIYFSNSSEVGQEVLLNPRGVPTDVNVNVTGWVPGGISFNADGYYTDLNLLLCSSNCEILPSELDAEVLRTAQGVLITPKKSACENSLAPIVGLYYLTKVSQNLIVHDPIVPGSYIDGALTSGVTSIFPSTTSATHVLIFRESNSQRSECNNTMFEGLQWSVIAIPAEEIAPRDDIQTVPAPPPTRIETLELTRENTPGAPIVVGQNQTVLEIPASTVSALTSSRTVSSVAVQTSGGTWRPASSALSTFIPIDSSVTDVKVKYTFADGTESVVTKPLISADVYEKALDAGSSSSSSPLMIIVIVLALLAILVGGFTFIRRRA
jgi:hypothetical protein